MAQKYKNGDRVIGNDVRASFRRRKGTVLRYEPKGQYWVQFDDGRLECVPTEWLAPEREVGQQGRL